MPWTSLPHVKTAQAVCQQGTTNEHTERKQTDAHTHTHMYTKRTDRSHTHTHTESQTHTPLRHIHVYMHIQSHMYTPIIYLYMYSFLHICIHIHTHKYTYTPGVMMAAIVVYGLPYVIRALGDSLRGNLEVVGHLGRLGLGSKRPHKDQESYKPVYGIWYTVYSQ